MSQKNAYSILNISKAASAEDVKTAHIEMVKKFDPERHTERFMAIQKAYKALGDPATRAKLDITIYTPMKGEFTFSDDERHNLGIEQVSQDVAKAKQALDSAPDDEAKKRDYFRALMRRSYLHMKSKSWSDAIADWTNVLRLDSTHLRSRNNLLFAYITLGYQYSQHGLHEEAVDLWARALKMNPDNVTIIHNLALACEQAGRTDQARTYWMETAKRWKAMLDDRPEDEYLKASVIEVHKKLGADAMSNAEEKGQGAAAAAEEYRQILSINPNDFDAQFQIAQTHMEAHQWEEAIAELRKLHKNHPKNIEVLNLLGWAYINFGEHDRAFKTWARSLALDKKNTATRDNIIRARLEVGKRMRERGIHMKSLVHFKELLKFLPKSPEVHYEIGQTYLAMNDRRSAVTSFNTVLKLDPRNKNAKKAISDLRLRE